MEVKLDYNYKGILPVPARALKVKKIFVGSLYLLLAGLIYSIFSFIAAIADGQSIKDFWISFSLGQFDTFAFGNIYSTIIKFCGILLSLFIIACGMMAIAAFDFELLRGNNIFSAPQAIKYCHRKLKQLFMSWIAIVMFALFLILFGVIVGLITRIPYLGDIVYSLVFFFPGFFISIFLVLIVYLFILSFLVMPSAVAFDKSCETFNSILETFSTIIRQPVRWLSYTIYTLIAAKITGFVFAYFAFRAVQLLGLMTQIGGGEKINNLISAGLEHLPVESKLVDFTTNIFPGVDFGFSLNTLFSSKSYDGPAEYIISISLFLVFLSVWGYIMSVVATGQAYAFAIIKSIRDGHAITEEAPTASKEM